LSEEPPGSPGMRLTIDRIRRAVEEGPGERLRSGAGPSDTSMVSVVY
jgi:hypothetical protein